MHHRVCQQHNDTMLKAHAQHVCHVLSCQTPLIDGKHISETDVFSFSLQINKGSCGCRNASQYLFNINWCLRHLTYPLFRQFYWTNLCILLHLNGISVYQQIYFRCLNNDSNERFFDLGLLQLVLGACVAALKIAQQRLYLLGFEDQWAHFGPSRIYEPRREKTCFDICEQQRRRSACASAQSDQYFCCSLPK